MDLGVSAPTVTALGALTDAVAFVAAVQGNAFPRPLLSTRVVLLTGAHGGGVVAGPAPDPRTALPLQHLAVTAGAGIVTLEWQPASAAIELEDAISPEQMDAAMRAGWAEADRAANEGIELLVLAAGGAGAATAAAAVVAAITGAEPPALLARVVTPAGRYDDNAWMARCLALRDALHRVRDRNGDPRTVLAALGGADIAAAVGLLLGAASRRTPVMIDGPVGAAAALLANDFTPQSRQWIMLPDHGRHPAVRLAAESLGLRPWLDLHLDLGEGATALAALPMLQTALTIAGVGEPVDTVSLTRYDTSGNQVFVGVARPVEPAIVDDGSQPDWELSPSEQQNLEQAFRATTVETAPVASATGDLATEPGAGEPAGAAAAGPAAASTKSSTSAAAKTTPSKAAPAPKDAAARATSAKDAAAKDAAAKAAPAKATPTTDPGAKDAGAKDATTKDAATKVAPAKAAPAKDAPSADAAGKQTAAREVPAKDTAAKDAARADAPAKDAPAKAAPANDTSATDASTKASPASDAGPTVPEAKDAAAKDSPTTAPTRPAAKSVPAKAADPPATKIAPGEAKESPAKQADKGGAAQPTTASGAPRQTPGPGSPAPKADAAAKATSDKPDAAATPTGDKPGAAVKPRADAGGKPTGEMADAALGIAADKSAAKAVGDHDSTTAANGAKPHPAGRTGVATKPEPAKAEPAKADAAKAATKPDSAKSDGPSEPAEAGAGAGGTTAPRPRKRP